MVPGGQSFEIIEGVRRAKAFELSGAQTIRAMIQNPDGTNGPETDVPLDCLRSPHKNSIDMSTNIQADRFWRIWKGIQGGQSAMIPPIPGGRGILIKDISWSY